ncbi:MAG: hypothetical protein HOE11_03400 [Candidatus Diapherotrites archaeon]|nr:hypothetical protein [Candidatus Diapherotrites archaeon]MBT4596414.1 hypothetical protein [Candidatus Diapherotrites archaeon]
MFSKKLLILVLFLLCFSISVTAISQTESVKIFAVTENNEGMSADLHLHVIPGNGEVAFITSNSLVGKDTQTTGNIAINVAEKQSTISAQQNNFVFDIIANAIEVDGPSAGAAMTLVAYSVLAERPLPQDIAVTGTINSDGSIGVVSGIYAKAKVASQIGINLFMIPKGEANHVIKENGKTTSINLLSYAMEEWGMKVVEVTAIEDVLEYAYSDIDSIEVDTTSSFIGFIPSAIKSDMGLEPMRKISQGYIDRAEALVEETKKELEVTELEESLRSSFYPQLGVAKRDIEMSQIFLDQNYLYSAANSSFNARVSVGTIKTIVKNPTILSKDSVVLNSEISSMRKELDSLKNDLDYIPLDKFEWIIGAQQRVAYAENALNKINETISGSFEGEDEEQIVMFGVIFDLIAAQAWIEVSRDLLEEANSSNVKKVPFYEKEFILKTKSKLISVNIFANDINMPEGKLAEVNRRLEAARISFDNNFYFATLYDIAIAESLSKAFVTKEKSDFSDLNGLYVLVDEQQTVSRTISSFWGNLFRDHSQFFLENARYQKEISRTSSEEANLNNAYDWVIVAQGLDETKENIGVYLGENTFDDYVGINASIDIKYTRTDVFTPVLIPALIVLVLLLIMIVVFSVRRSPGKVDAARAEKLDSMLNRLDKALAKGKVSEPEYFFLKKKYDDEFSYVNNMRSKRSKIALNLDESRAKLSALEQGAKDLKKHYHSGLIIPEDYERHLSEVNSEIAEIKEDIDSFEDELRESRRGKNRRTISADKVFLQKEKQNPFSVKGTDTKENAFSVKGTNEKTKPRRKKILTRKKKK